MKLSKLSKSEFEKIAKIEKINNSAEIYVLYVSIEKYADFVESALNFYEYMGIFTADQNDNMMSDFEIDFEYFANRIYDIEYLTNL